MKRPVLLILLLAAASAQAHDLRHHEAHVHGQANVDLALDNGSLELALRAPGIGILSFERAPASAAERTALASAQSVLKSGSWISLPSAARCRLASSDVSAEGFAAAPSAGTPRAQGHAGFTATLRYQCANPAGLRALRLRLPVLFPGLHEVIVNTATDAGQGRQRITADDLRVPLAP